MRELAQLLNEYWIIKDADKEGYYRLRDVLVNFRSFLVEKLGYQVIVTPDLIKLEKLPGQAEAWMGIEAFDNPMEYAFLCLLLMFLEDKGREDQFLLSELTEFIEGTFPGEEKVDWTLYAQRRYLIKVLKFAMDMGMIRINDGDESGFAGTRESEALYENTGISKYFMRNFTGNILNYETLAAFENDEWLDMDQDVGRIRRNKVYRKIIMAPAVYRDGDDDPDYLYIKNYRNIIQADMEKYFGASLHVHRNGIFLVFDADSASKHTFPEQKAISDITLQLNKLLTEKIKQQELLRNKGDIVVLGLHHFAAIVQELREKYLTGWSKEYREMKSDKLVEALLAYMKNFTMIEVFEAQQEIKLLPLVGKIVGDYPKDFRVRSEVDGQKSLDDE